MKQKKLIERVGKEEAQRRAKQRQLDRKKNPNKKKSKNEKNCELNLQTCFLFEIRIAKESGNVQEVLNRYKEQVGDKTLNQLIKRCNISHWIS